MRREIVSVEGRSLGKVTSLALLQSTYSVLSFFGDSQKARSLASLENSGMGLRGLLIDDGRRALLVARKNKELSSEQLRQDMIERVTRAVQYYWELAYAYQYLEVQKEAVRLMFNNQAANQ